MKVISIINYKGGVGKTTLTANVAAQLAYRGKRILVVDMDAQCSLTFSFITPDQWAEDLGGDGIAGKDRTIKRWFDGLIDDDLEEVSFESLILDGLKVNEYLGNENGRLHLLPSHLGLINIDLDLAYMLTGVAPGRLNRRRAKVYGELRNHLKEYATNVGYDFVLIDCPPNFNIVTKNAIVASDEIIIPAKPDYLSTLGIDYLLRSLHSLVSEFNEGSKTDKIKPHVLGVVFTMIQIYGGQPIGAQRQYMNEDTIAVPVFATNMRENKTMFADAPEGGIPVVLEGYTQEPYSTIVSEIEALTKEFLEKSGE